MTYSSTTTSAKKTSTVYKLTDNEGWTRKGSINECKWGEGVTHTAKGPGNKLCTSGVIHAYLSPELAVLLNCIHANIKNPRLWLAETVIVASDGQLKVGGKSLKAIREIPLPVFTDRQKVIFALLCAEAVLSKVKSPNKEYNDCIIEFNTWKEKYLKGNIATTSETERTAAGAAARAAARAAEAAEAAEAAGATAGAAAEAAEAARAAVRAAEAARAAAGAAAWAAARAAAWAAEAARAAAGAAAGAAAWAAEAAEAADLDLVGIAKRALEFN